MKEASIEEFMQAIQSSMGIDKDDPWLEMKKLWEKWEKLAQELSPQQRGYFLSLGEEGMKELAQHYDWHHLKLSIQIGLERVMEHKEEQRQKEERERADLLLYQEAIQKGIYPLERMPIHPLELETLREKIEKANPERWEQLMWLYNHERKWRVTSFCYWIAGGAGFLMIYHLHLDILFYIVRDQTQMELAILDRTQAQIQRAEGITDMEILQEARINPYHYLIIDPCCTGRNYWECLQRDKELMAHSNMSLEALVHQN
ncbi:hypothetical protein NHP190020_01430 [Helicobacter suis]|uniref:Uncharacterized protein n=1 Tax=Helicobacter suis TaxID=104628 RepID=A0ABM7KXA0_9HELI|nr:hypothetical protein NHP190020_01430 [Helicobacter suis]